MKKGEITKNLLLAAQSAGSLGGLNLSENTKGNLQPFVEWYKKQNKYGRYRIRKSFSALEDKGLITISKNQDGSLRVLLTEVGKNEIFKYKTEDIKLIPLPTWDKRWRIIISDCKDLKARIALKNKFKKLGLYEIQKNIWAYPHDCKQQVLDIANSLKISNVKFAEANFLEGESELKKIFSL